MNFDSLGNFEITSGAMQVTDPCYTGGDGVLLSGVKNGVWKAYTTLNDGTNTEIIVHHVEHELALGDFVRYQPQNMYGAIGVDSGQAGFFDADTLATHNHDHFYEEVCNLTLGTLGAGVIKYGAVSSSGWGDGSYELFIATENGQVVAARIDFVGQEEEQDNELDEDDEDFEDDNEDSTDQTSSKNSRYNF
jgi:hypothetical protein